MRKLLLSFVAALLLLVSGFTGSSEAQFGNGPQNAYDGMFNNGGPEANQFNQAGSAMPSANIRPLPSYGSPGGGPVEAPGYNSVMSGDQWGAGDSMGSSQQMPCGSSVTNGGGNESYFAQSEQYNGPGQLQNLQAMAAPKNRHAVLSVAALSYFRDYEANRLLSTSGSGSLFSNDTDHDGMAGIDVSYKVRRSNGMGWEARYFELFPEIASNSISDPASVTALTGLSNLTDGFGGPTATFASAPTHVINRDTELRNIEFNLLRNAKGGVFPRLARMTGNDGEWIFGGRYLLFGETLLYQAIDPTNGPSRTDYLSSVENQMVGMQIGRRSNKTLGSRFGLHWGWKTGVFGNSVSTRQRVDNVVGGVISNPTTVGGTTPGTAFDIGGSSNGTSLIAELELAVSIQMNRRMRARVGYKAMGLTDVALAGSQIGTDFSDLNAIRNTSDRDNLFFHGLNAGLEIAF